MAAIDTLKQGYAPLYHRGERNICPSCGALHWYIGRFSAECGYCHTTLPFAPTSGAPAAPHYPSWSARA